MSHRTLAKKINKMKLEDVSEQEADVGSFIRAKTLAKLWDCDVRTIKRMVLRGELKGFRRGGAVVIPRADVARYIAANEIKPTEKVAS